MEQTIWQTYQDQDVMVFGINFAEQEDVVEEFVENFGLTFTILLDTSGQVYLRYNQQGSCNSPFPLDYIVDQSGLIAYGACEYLPDSMVAVIEELLEQGPSGAEDPFGSRGSQAAIELDWIRPHPVRGEAVIRYILARRGWSLVDVLDSSGRRLRRLWQGLRQAGPHVLAWDGRDAQGRRLPAGTYFLRVALGEEAAVRKVLVLE